MLISIKEANETKTSRGNPMLQVVTTTGEKMACFHAGLCETLRLGATVDVTTEKRGNYSPNIVSAVVHPTNTPIPLSAVMPATNPALPAEHAGAKSEIRISKSETNPNIELPNDKIRITGTRPIEVPPPSQVRGEFGRGESIEAQTAAKNVTELICAGKIEVSGVAGQLAMAWNIGKLEAALPEAVVSAVMERTRKAK